MYIDLHNILMFYSVFQGDSQTPVTMLIVLGAKLRPRVEEYIQENWFLSYLGKFLIKTYKCILCFLYARLVGTYYGMGRASVCLSVRLSVCLSVHKACKHDTDWMVPARTVKVCTHTTYDKGMTPIDFQGLGSKVKVTRLTLL